MAGSPGVGRAAAKASPAERIREPMAAVAAAAAEVFRKLRRDWVTGGLLSREEVDVSGSIYELGRDVVRDVAAGQLERAVSPSRPSSHIRASKFPAIHPTVNTRRQFLIQAPVGLLAAVAAR